MEGDGSARLESRQIQGGACRDGNVVEDNGGARSLALDGRRSVSEGATSSSFKSSRGSRDERASAEEHRSEFCGNHDVRVVILRMK